MHDNFEGFPDDKLRLTLTSNTIIDHFFSELRKPDSSCTDISKLRYTGTRLYEGRYTLCRRFVY